MIEVEEGREYVRKRMIKLVEGKEVCRGSGDRRRQEERKGMLIDRKDKKGRTRVSLRREKVVQ